MTRQGNKLRARPIAYTVSAARNFPATNEYSPTGEVSSIWSVRFFRSSLILFMVIKGITIMPHINIIL